jgi:hypothetical protein
LVSSHHKATLSRKLPRSTISKANDDTPDTTLCLKNSAATYNSSTHVEQLVALSTNQGGLLKLQCTCCRPVPMKHCRGISHSQNAHAVKVAAGHARRATPLLHRPYQVMLSKRQPATIPRSCQWQPTKKASYTGVPAGEAHNSGSDTYIVRTAICQVDATQHQPQVFGIHSGGRAVLPSPRLSLMVMQRLS